MEETLQSSRLYIFLGFFFLFSLLEMRFEKHPRLNTRAQRWGGNLGLSLLSSLLLRLLFPLGLSSFAFKCQEQSWGLMNWGGFDSTSKTILSLILLDFFIYWQHVLTHKVPFLWRLHRVHHTDEDLDASSALRFHPLEILISYGFKVLLTLLFGFSPLGVVLFEILLNTSAMFNHANLRLPKRLDSWLRKVIVTPDMHIIHHSVEQRESDSNFGFFFSLWDRVFGTYQEIFLSRGLIGQKGFKGEKAKRLNQLLIQPWKTPRP